MASEWKLEEEALVRPLRGAELLVRASEHYNDGNYQLTFKASFETSLTNGQLKARHHGAWYRTRRIHPVVGVAFPTLTTASFALHTSPEQAQEWTDQTTRIAENTTVHDVYLARSRENCTHPTMTLVLHPIRGSRGCVLNMSHVLISTNMFDVMQEYIVQLADPATESGIEGHFTKETLDMRNKLPQSLSHAYEIAFQPTPQDLKQAQLLHESTKYRFFHSSTGIPLHPNFKTRPSILHNKTIAFEPALSAAVFPFLKTVGVSLTSAFFAAMTAAMTHSYPQKVDGAHLLFSTHARRFLDTNGVTMPILPSNIWLGSSTIDLGPTTQSGILSLATTVEELQRAELFSSHIVGVVDGLGKTMARHPGQAKASETRQVGVPTLTSQGQISNDRDKELMAMRDRDGWVHMTDFNTGGRSTVPGVCFALNSFRDELRFNMLFDEKYFDPAEVCILGLKVQRLFTKLIGLEGV